ncbi:MULTISPECIES: hypothetical protein [unclassified Marinovum]
MHLILILIALIAGAGGAGRDDAERDVASGPSKGAISDTGADTGAESGADTGTSLTAEPQVPTGRFTTATEIRSILDATKGNWVAVREYDGRDLVYFTHLLAWRCGLAQMEYGINGGAMQVFALPPCHEDMATPNALLPEDGLPYVGFGLGSVQTIELRITYDDLGADAITVDRRGVLIP